MGVVRGEDGVGLVEDMADVEAKKLVEVEVGVGLVEDMTDVEAKKSEEVEVGPLVVVMLVVVILVVVELIMEVELLIMEVDGQLSVRQVSKVCDHACQRCLERKHVRM